jgi:hypothetical protein
MVRLFASNTLTEHRWSDLGFPPTGFICKSICSYFFIKTANFTKKKVAHGFSCRSKSFCNCLGQYLTKYNEQFVFYVRGSRSSGTLVVSGQPVGSIFKGQAAQEG